MTEPATRKHEEDWEEEDRAARLMELEDRVANRVDELEERVATRLMELEDNVGNRMYDLEERSAKLERGMVEMNDTNVRVATWRMFLGKVDEGLGWIEDRQYDLEDRLDAMEDEEGKLDGSGQGSSRSTSPLTTAPPSHTASSTAPTRSPSVALSGPGSHEEMRMDLPSSTAESEVLPVADNLAAALAQRESSLPQVNIIPATPQSSQKEPRSHVAPTISASTMLTTLPATSPSSSTAPPTAPTPISTSIATPTWVKMPPPPPWEESVPHDEASGRPVPSMSLLAPPAPDAGHPKSPRRGRSRSPSPAPTRRSPRLQSPVPSTQVTPAAPTSQHEGLGNSMDIDG
jgi:hypothetical protein